MGVLFFMENLDVCRCLAARFSIILMSYCSRCSRFSARLKRVDPLSEPMGVLEFAEDLDGGLDGGLGAQMVKKTTYLACFEAFLVEIENVRD